VSGDWLARGIGQPIEAGQAVILAESPTATYEVTPSPPVTTPVPAWPVEVRGAFRSSGTGDIEPQSLSRDEVAGHIHVPLPDARVHAMRVKGNALVPYAKDGQYLMLQAAGPDLAPEENIVITLASGKMLIRELMYKRADSVVVLPLHGGQPEAIEAADIVRIDVVMCVAPRRWWGAG
jgi:hypothetical protein